jgi:hypothetical protein
MIKAATFLCAQVAVATVALSMSGAAFAQEIGCVDGIPAPPITHSCPSTVSSGAFAQAPTSHVSSHALKHRYVRHVSQ